LFVTRLARLFAYGFLAVVLMLYLAQAGLSEVSIGLLLTLTLIGDTVISLWLTTRADRFGRRRTLIVGSLLMMLAAAVFAGTQEFIPLLIAATIGVISPSGNEVGPFLSIEQAALSQLVPDRQRTQVFSWYNLVGSFATACGALCGGGLAQLLQNQGVTPLNSYRAIVIGYGLIGLLLAWLFTRLSRAVEVPPSQTPLPAEIKVRLACINRGGWSSNSRRCSRSMRSREALWSRVLWPIGSMCALARNPARWARSSLRRIS
jgi:MFS family permease